MREKIFLMKFIFTYTRATPKIYIYFFFWVCYCILIRFTLNFFYQRESNLLLGCKRRIKKGKKKTTKVEKYEKKIEGTNEIASRKVR